MFKLFKKKEEKTDKYEVLLAGLVEVMREVNKNIDVVILNQHALANRIDCNNGCSDKVETKTVKASTKPKKVGRKKKEQK